MLGVALIPSGELTGRPAYAVQADRLDYTDPRCLLHELLQRRQPGVRAVQLVSAPWGTPELDQAIDWLSADPRTAELVVWEERAATQTSWSAGPVWWALELSSLLHQPTTASRLVSQLQLLPPIPRPSELLVRDPHEQLAAGYLDELTTRLDCEVGWIYATPGSRTWLAAEVAIAQACGSWGLRAG